MKQSDLYTQIANDMMTNGRNTATYIADLCARLPEGEYRDALAAALANVRREFLAVSSRALHAAQMLMHGGDTELPEPKKPVDAFASLLDGFFATLPPTPGCDCKACNDKRAKRETKPEAKPARAYMIGDRVEYRYRSEESWRDGVFNGRASDGSGFILVRADGTDYRIAPENVRWHPPRAESEPANGVPVAAHSE